MPVTVCSTVNSSSHQPSAIWVVVPVHNNGATIESVARQCRAYVENVLVVDDGSTDREVARLFEGTDICVLTHPVNKGKGAALRSAIRYLLERDAEWMITLDGDDQHFPDDLPVFLEAIPRHPESILVGARDFSGPDVPASSRFGRRFSNMWIRLESGASVSDSQSGFRAYPLRYLAHMTLQGDRYEFEVDILTRAAWHGLSLVDVPIRVWYPKRKEDAISSFRPWRDNARISLVHARLCMRRLWPWPHRRLVKRPEGALSTRYLLTHPYQTVKRVLTDNTSPMELGLAAAVGSFLAVLPLIGAHTAAILYFATRFRLNLVMALNIQHLYVPPFTPVACIVVGHYIRYRTWISVPDSFRGAVTEIPQYLLFWLIGSLLLAPILAVLAGSIVYLLAHTVKRRNRVHASASRTIQN